ncbi:uncharacterized protein LOC114935206 [Nylanderia fulva]|uniref:uncharacterized protein LOC114935206 n=1 Tax=Nylanderia fulva TaxID=613905 RepID=UPI0010FB4B43|nr:uncharacterized protein LOC114935206 [Nylanderia fulva]
MAPNKFETCKNDNDCLDKQYCYDISGRCVNILDCSKYNRMKGEIPAREPSQCGPCMKEYSTEILATDKENLLCYYTKDQVELNTTGIIWIIVGIILAVISIIYLLYAYRNCIRRIFTRNSNSNNSSDIPEVTSNNFNGMVVASAPEEEQEPFIGFGKKRCDYVPQNNNEGIKETNQYQKSFPFLIEPQNRPINEVINNYNINQPICRDVAIPIPAIEENHRNTEREEADLSISELYTSNSNENGDTTDSACKPNNQDEQKSKSHNIIINQMVQQNITLHLNGDE